MVPQPLPFPVPLVVVVFGAVVLAAAFCLACKWVLHPKKQMHTTADASSADVLEVAKEASWASFLAWQVFFM